MLFHFMAILAATFVQALPAPDSSGLATTTIDGFEVVIVYVTPQTGCPATPTSCGALFPTSTSPAGLPDKHPEAKPSAKTSSSHSQPAPVATLKPNLHWDCDTKPAKNVIPVPPEDGSKMYYGINDPTKAGEYAWLTYFFKQPSVNLDHTDSIINIEYSPNGLEMHFNSDEAWEYAVESWSKKDDLVLITYVEGCGAYEKQDRCFFLVKNIIWKEGKHSIIAKGKPTHPDELISRGESEWGYYTPKEKPSKRPPGTQRPPGTNTGDGASSGSSRPGAGACVPPADDKYGLQTACLGDSFDHDLDALLGSQDLSDQYQEFLDSIDEDVHGNSTLQRRGFFDFIGDVVDVIVKPVEAVFDVITDALAVSADIDKEFNFKLPDTGSELGGGLVQTTSPWGDAIQLFKEELPSSDGLSGHVSVYCVGCSVNGRAKLYGKAKWVPFKGIEEGFIEVNADLQLALKLGIDAAIQFSHNVHYDLFSMGLPGLSFGVISIGPRIDVGANVGLEASASGKLLAGADMNLQNAVARLDFKDSDKTDVSGFDPNFVPVFEAEGRIKASASLGLPVGIHVGIKIAMFDLSAGIVDEPSIKATAEVAAKVSLGEDGLEGGFVEVNGCPGIHGQISWRNKLDLKASFFKDKNILDTGDKVLTELCIPLGSPAVPQPAQPPAIEPPAVEPPAVEPPIVDPPATQPSAAEPVATELPIESAIIEPPINDGVVIPPAVESPVQETPDTEPHVPEVPEEDGQTTVVPPLETSQSPPFSTPASPSGFTPISSNPSGSASTPSGAAPTPSGAASTPSGHASSPAASAAKTSSTSSATSPRPAKPSGAGSVGKPGQAFEDEDGLEFASLVSSSSSVKVAGCSNGNVYVVSKGGENTPSCSDLWSFKEDALVADSMSRALHYYNNTMSLLGVSRLRIGDESSVPDGGVLVMWAPVGKNEDDTEDNKMYLAVDINERVFYPVVCNYIDKAGAKVFLTEDPSKGVETLKDKDIQYSITGGKVKECSPLLLAKTDSLTYGKYGARDT